MPIYSPDDEPCPAYHTIMKNSSAIMRSDTISSSSGTDVSCDSVQRPRTRTQLPLDNQRETYLYTYHLSAGGVPTQFLILAEPSSGRPTQGKCTFNLWLRVHNVERILCDPIELNLCVDPRQLEFVVFIFPGKVSLPASCLYSYRVWLRCNGVDHRLFSGEDLWIGQDPNFDAVEGASFARLKRNVSGSQVYQSIIGRAVVLFTIRWRLLDHLTYEYTLEYEAGGVGSVLTTWKLRVAGDPRLASFTIYSVPMKSTPANASHRLRLWLRTITPFPGETSPAACLPLPFNDSYIYQRLWKSDTFKVGAQLNFDALSSSATIGFAVGSPRVILTSSPLYTAKEQQFPEPIRHLPPIPAEDEQHL